MRTSISHFALPLGFSPQSVPPVCVLRYRLTSNFRTLQLSENTQEDRDQMQTRVWLVSRGGASLGAEPPQVYSQTEIDGSVHHCGDWKILVPKLYYSIELSLSLVRYLLPVMKLLGRIGVWSWGQRMDSRQSCAKQSSPLEDCLLHKARQDRGIVGGSGRGFTGISKARDSRTERLFCGGHRRQWVDADACFVAVHLKKLLHG